MEQTAETRSFVFIASHGVLFKIDKTTGEVWKLWAGSDQWFKVKDSK